MTLFKSLHQIGLAKLSVRKVKEWRKEESIEDLIYALETGRYAVRNEAAKALGFLRAKSAIPILRKSLNDQVELVSMSVIEALQKIGVSSKIEKEIEAKIKYWDNKRKSRHENNDSNYYHEKPKWKKRDWKAIIKQQLRKPMRWG